MDQALDAVLRKDVLKLFALWDHAVAIIIKKCFRELFKVIN